MTTDTATGSTRHGRIHAGEGGAVVLSALYFFCVLAAYYVIRPVRDQLSAAVGSTQLPRFYAATFLATLLLTPLFAWLAARHPRRVLGLVVYGFFIACLLAFVPLFSNHASLSPRTLGTIFFVWLSVFSLFAVSVFCSFMTDIWDAAQARRLFPLIAFGGAAGAIAGPALTRSLVESSALLHCCWCPRACSAPRCARCRTRALGASGRSRSSRCSARRGGRRPHVRWPEAGIRKPVHPQHGDVGCSAMRSARSTTRW